MASSSLVIEKVASINRKKTSCTIRVKVLRIWESAYGWGSRKPIELLLVDEEGTRIEAEIRPEHLDNFICFPMLYQDRWIDMSHFNVTPNLRLGALTPHVYRIYSSERTNIDCVPRPTKNHFLMFKSIKGILDESVPKTYPIDIVGVITHVGKLRRGQPSKDDTPFGRWLKTSIKFVIRDNELNGIVGVARGEVAEDLDKKWRERGAFFRMLQVVLVCFKISGWGNYIWLRPNIGASIIDYDAVVTIKEARDYVTRFPFPAPTTYKDDLHEKDDSFYLD